MKPPVFALLMFVLAASASAQMGGGTPGGMPDAKSMSGTPLPMAEMTPGSVSVRVVRGSLSNPIAGQRVELTLEGETREATTDETGRATFDNVRVGATVTLRTVVGTETLDSKPFQVPAQGGVRLMLVATDPDAAKEAAEAKKLAQSPAQPGPVSLGSQSRIHVELSEESAEVYYLLEILNAAKVPVEPATLFAFELPEGASGSSVLEGSSPNATAAGRKVTVRGPFAPGVTTVQVAFRLPYSGGSVSFTQAFPAGLEQPVLSVTKKVPGVSVSSSHFHDAREMANDGQVLLVAHAKSTPANTPMDVRVNGVPAHPAWPRYLALTLAGLIIAAGAWLAAIGPRRAAEKSAAIKQLENRREKLFAELAALDQRRRTGTVPDAQYQRRRQEIIADLERVYVDLDQGAAA